MKSISAKPVSSRSTELGRRLIATSARALAELTTGEIAMIVGLIKGPNTYAPTKHPVLAQQRRDVVLRLLREQGQCDRGGMEGRGQSTGSGGAARTMSWPMRPISSTQSCGRSRRPLGRLCRKGCASTARSIRCCSRSATEGLEHGLARLERAYPALKGSDQPLQGAVVVLDPSTGAILALVGGRDYRVSQFNRAVQAHRQAGSLFKPFVYLAAFEASRTGMQPYMTPASLLADEPVTFESEGGRWSPQNYDKQFRGNVTLRSALEQSLNVPAVRVAKAVGTQPILDVIRQLGVTTRDDQ